MNSFNPPIRTLMGPGPSDIHPRVLAAMSRPTIGHLDPEFIRMMDEIKVMLKYAFQTNNEMTMPVSAPGSAGMETCFVNLVEPGDKAVVCINGVFGGRMKKTSNVSVVPPLSLKMLGVVRFLLKKSKPLYKPTQTLKSSPLCMQKPQQGRVLMPKPCVS